MSYIVDGIELRKIGCPKDLKNIVFERWTVIEFSHQSLTKNNTKVYYWKCFCNCINKTLKLVEERSLLRKKANLVDVLEKKNTTSV